jgi:hypothetical protein
MISVSILDVKIVNEVSIIEHRKKWKGRRDENGVLEKYNTGRVMYGDLQ